ncbi:MAG: ribose-5-phosphate isomerase RpiA [Mangrovibacterium sp.]
MNHKQLVGEAACEYIKDGMTVGLGTGSTAYYTIMKVGEMVRNGLNIKAVPTSESTEKLAREQNIPLIDIAEVMRIDVGIDGADEFDKNKQLIKGGGGALLREKIVASLCETYVVIADCSKKSEFLGSFALPVEVTPFAKEVTQRQLSELGCDCALRRINEVLFITDNGNYIIDCKFKKIEDPTALSTLLNTIPGVVENGLFVNTATYIVCTDTDGNLQIIK